MEVQLRIHGMNGGEGKTSYAHNSLPQRAVLYKTKPILEEALQKLCSATIPKAMGIADLGCSSGPNSLLPLSMILDTVHGYCLQFRRSPPEFQVFLNDLPDNDFNTLFRTIPSFCDKIRVEKGEEFGPCFITGTPGSFYGRLFPSESLHFVYSANSLHWLSQVPQGLVCDMGDLNRGNIALGCTSPPSVYQMYFKQFRRDFCTFLEARSIEVVPGGCMVLSMLGRRMADPFSEECRHYWDDLGCALRELVIEGVVEEAKVDSLNIPFYEPHKEELKQVVQEQGSFDIVRLEEPSRASHPHDKLSKMIDHNVLANCARAVIEPTLVRHFGPELMDKLFHKFPEKLLQGGSRRNVVLIVSLIRKG